ncbi:AAA family ATPase [Georgenia subflava]|uniref:AAA family ATPase n=1 Tax=Georgenia subflava TaxID=1622177 RepID=UPI00186B509E|nr:hypothetical protein [Georgenia subflava]
MSVGVLLALTGPVESSLVQVLDGSGSGVRVVRRCADVPEVLAAAAAGLGAVAVLSADLPGVDRTVVSRLRAAGVRTVLVAEAVDVDRCAALGADAVEVLPQPVQALADVVTAVASAVGTGGGVPPTGRRATADGAGDGAGAGRAPGVRTGEPGPLPVARGAATDRSADGPAADGPPVDVPAAADTEAPADGPDGGASAPPQRGRLVTVWGPPGAPGRTTLAVTLAAELATLSGSALLVDADTEAPAITQVLGILDDSSAVAALARHAANGRLDRATLRRLCPVVDDTLRVMTGLTRADRWRELPEAALEVVWDVARESAPWTVVDTGAALETGAGDGTFGPRRHQATLSALRAADVVVVVGAGEPVGMRRLVMALGELTDEVLLTPGTERVVVVNRVRASAAGPSPARSIHEALVRFAGVDDAVLVPDDRPALDKAVLQGRTLTAVAPASPARLAVEQLARRLAGERERRGRRRRTGAWPAGARH